MELGELSCVFNIVLGCYGEGKKFEFMEVDRRIYGVCFEFRIFV